MPANPMVVYAGGVAVFRLEPVAPAVPIPAGDAVPSFETLQLGIDEGRLPAHESKTQLKRVQLSSYMWSVQKNLGLATGVGGGWSQAAGIRLQAWLLKPYQQSKKAPAPLALLDRQVEAPLAHGASSDSESSSSSDDDEESVGNEEVAIETRDQILVRVGDLEDLVAADTEAAERRELLIDDLGLEIQGLKRRIAELER
jgi:hypothetical protein